MTRAELKSIIKNAVDNELEEITITGSFGCGEETFEIKIDHINKVFYCEEYFPICVLCDIREVGYKDMGGVNMSIVEFANRLKEHYPYSPSVCKTIDKVANEML